MSVGQRMDFEVDAVAILATAHPNVLLVGPEDALARGLEVIGQFLRPPTVTWTPSERLALPAGRCGTLIVRSIDAADIEQQRRLLDWMNERPGTAQLVSTTGEALLTRIVAGAFLETLYYRLNHVTFRVPNDFAWH